METRASVPNQSLAIAEAAFREAFDRQVATELEAERLRAEAAEKRKTFELELAALGLRIVPISKPPKRKRMSRTELQGLDDDALEAIVALGQEKVNSTPWAKLPRELSRRLAGVPLSSIRASLRRLRGSGRLPFGTVEA